MKPKAIFDRPLFPVLLYLFVFICLLLVKSNILNTPYHWDFMGYVARSSSGFYQTNHMSSLTDISGHPPLFFMALATAWKTFGRSFLTSHVLILLFGALSLTLVFLLTKRLYGIKEATAAALLLLSNQLFFAQTGLVLLSVPLTSLAILTVFFYVRQKNGLFILSASAMLLVKETSVIVLMAVILFDFCKQMIETKKIIPTVKRVLFLSLPVIPLAAWYLYHWQTAGWFVNTKLIVNRSQFLKLFLDNSFRYLIYDRTIENVNKANWLVTIALVLFLVFQFFKRKKLNFEILFFLIVFMNIFFFSYTDDLPRYFLVMYPFYFILGARAFVYLSQKSKHQNIFLPLGIIAVIALSVMNYHGNRNTAGWRLESNMEYLDFVSVNKQACQFLENHYPEHKIVAIFPIDRALRNPWFGYVKKPLSVIPLDNFDLYEDVLIVRASRSNDIFARRYFHINPDELEQIAEFSLRGKKVVIYRKKKRIPPMENARHRRVGNSAMRRLVQP